MSQYIIIIFLFQMMLQSLSVIVRVIIIVFRCRLEINSNIYFCYIITNSSYSNTKCNNYDAKEYFFSNHRKMLTSKSFSFDWIAFGVAILLALK